MAQVLAEYEADGCLVEKATVQPADWDAIIARCDVAILQDPANSKTFVERGNAHLNKGDGDQAITDYDTAISLEPDYTEEEISLLKRKETGQHRPRIIAPAG